MNAIKFTAKLVLTSLIVVICSTSMPWAPWVPSLLDAIWGDDSEDD